MFKLVKRRKVVRSTKNQIKSLLEYMSFNKAFANTAFRGPNGFNSHLAEWKALQGELNKEGPKKTVDQWRVTWKDLKKKARDERLKYDKAIENGSDQFPELSLQSKLILSIIDSEYEVPIDNKEGERDIDYEDDTKNEAGYHQSESNDDLEKECNLSVDSNEMTEHILSQDSSIKNSYKKRSSTKRLRDDDSIEHSVRFPDSSVIDNTNDLDECALFGQLVAKKLNRLPEERRDAMMVKINQMFIDERFENIPTYPVRSESESNRSDIEKHFIVSPFN